MTDTFQWERCTVAGGSGCADIGGATNPTYVSSGDIGDYVRARGYRNGILVGESDPVGPIAAAPPPGAILYSNDYPVGAPNFGFDWGFYSEQSPAPAVLVPDGFRAGVPSLRITMPPGSGTLHAEGVKKWILTLGEDLYFGLACKFHSPWPEPPDGWGFAILQGDYQAFVNSTWGLFAHHDHVRLVDLAGQQSWSGTPNQAGIGLTREYNNTDGAPQGPSPRVITGLVTDAWYRIVVRVKAEYGSTGVMQAWVKGGSYADWTQTVNVTNVPTLQWGVSNTGGHLSNGATGYTVSQKFGGYTGTRSASIVYENARIKIGTSLAAVQAAVA